MTRSGTLTTQIEHNAILILDGLTPADMSVNYIRDELVHLASHHADGATPMKKTLPVPSKLALRETLRAVTWVCGAHKLRPILHIEAHGDENGIAVGEQQERVSWRELATMLRKVNAATRCNLGVVMAACQGWHATSAVASLREPAPFLWLVGHEERFEAADLQRDMPVFYRELWRTWNLAEATKAIKPFRHFNAELYLFQKLEARYWTAGRSRHIAQHSDWMLSFIRNNFAGVQDADIPEVRRMLKESLGTLRVSPQAVEALGNQFLHRRKQRFAFAHLAQWLQSTTEKEFLKSPGAVKAKAAIKARLVKDGVELPPIEEDSGGRWR